MRIPISVIIGPHTYNVTFEKLATNHQKLGHSHHALSEIKIDIEQSLTQKEDTFIHEVLHCIFQQISLASALKTKDPEEEIVSVLTPRILEFIKDNIKTLV